MQPWQLRPARDHGLGPGERFASVRREPGLLEAMALRLSSVVTAGFLRTWHRLRVEGAEHLPTSAPFVLVANHTSHLDAITLASLVPWRLRQVLYPIAAGDVFFESPGRALLSSFLLNALPMQRRHTVRHALAELRERLVEDRCAYVLFPEGSRSGDGALQPFKAGIGMLVAGTDVPVVPCHLRGAFAAWPRQARLPRPRRVAVRVGAARVFRDVPDDRDGWQRIAAELQAAVAALGG